eukprot:1896239-Rhodomonas_salina.2
MEAVLTEREGHLLGYGLALRVQEPTPDAHPQYQRRYAATPTSAVCYAHERYAPMHTITMMLRPRAHRLVRPRAHRLIRTRAHRLVCPRAHRLVRTRAHRLVRTRAHRLVRTRGIGWYLSVKWPCSIGLSPPTPGAAAAAAAAPPSPSPPPPPPPTIARELPT